MKLSVPLAAIAILPVLAQENLTDILTCPTWVLGDEFGEVNPMHHNITAIVEYWRPLAEIQEVPFYDGNITDFEPIWDYLIKHNISDMYSPAYTKAYYPTAESLLQQAEDAESANDTQLAGELYTRAAVVYRLARYPTPINPTIFDAWHRQTDAYFRGSKYLDPPVYNISIPHTYAANGDGSSIPLALRHPTNSSVGSDGSPVLLMMTGLDQFRVDFNPLTKWATTEGFEVVLVEIPGTGDSPANRSDPDAGDRLWSSILDWVETQPGYDADRVLVWGFSTGSYYAIRAAHTHADRLHASVAQSVAVHKAFEREWLLQMDTDEDPYEPTPALTYKWGYDSLEDLLENNQKDYSLVLNGILDGNHTNVLMVNGMHDTFFPADDAFIPLNFGQAKQIRMYPDQAHMGGGEAFTFIQQWLVDML